MKIMRVTIILVMLSFISGCAGSGIQSSSGNVQSDAAHINSKTFEISEIQLMVSPKPADASKILFNQLAGPYMAGTMNPMFGRELNELLKRDMGATVDYSKLRSQMRYKTSQKPGFVWDSNLYAWMATKKFSTGKRTIEIKSYAPNPTISGFETVITVKEGGTVLKQYKTDAVMGADVPDASYNRRVQDYVAYIPMLLKLGIRGAMIHDNDMADYVRDFHRVVNQFKLKENPPEEDLKRLREMITDIDPSSGIVVEDLYAPGEESAEESAKEKGSGATLLD